MNRFFSTFDRTQNLITVLPKLFFKMCESWKVADSLPRCSALVAVVVRLPVLRQWLDFKLSPPPHPRFPFHGLFESTLPLLLLLSPHVGRMGGCPPSALPREEGRGEWLVGFGGGRKGRREISTDGTYRKSHVRQPPPSIEKGALNKFFSSSPECSSHFSIPLSNHLFSPLFESGARAHAGEEEPIKKKGRESKKSFSLFFVPPSGRTEI